MSRSLVPRCALVALLTWLAPATAVAADRHWVGTWTASSMPPSNEGLSLTGVADRTIRQTVHTSIGGKRVRVRLTNVFGAAPLTIDEVGIALPGDGAGVDARTRRPVTFDGATRITIPRGARVVSDPIRLRVRADAGVVVSLYVSAPTGPMTWHAIASQTTYVSRPGNHVSEPGGDAFPIVATSFFLLDGLEVLAPRRTGAIVTLGSSITDGLGSTLNADRRYPNVLARRVQALGRRGRSAVLDAGISGNRILTDSVEGGVGSLARFDRDVLTQSGVRTLVVLEGINDIGFASLPPGSGGIDASVEALIAGHRQIIEQARAKGLRVLGGTLLPYEGAFYYSAEGETKRQALNAWIRNESDYDGIVDFDAVMGDPTNPLRLDPRYDSGDRLHPGDAGYAAMGEAVRLRCVDPRKPLRRGSRTRCTTARR